LEWARARGCGFMETSARECVNVEETFALIVRRVVEARRLHALPRSQKLAAGATTSNPFTGNSFSRTEPLTPLNEKGGRLGYMDPSAGSGSPIKKASWWGKLRCW